jgi:hypothetical protein
MNHCPSNRYNTFGRLEDCIKEDKAKSPVRWSTVSTTGDTDMERNSSCRLPLTGHLEFRRNRSESTAQKTSRPDILTRRATHEYVRNPQPSSRSCGNETGVSSLSRTRAIPHVTFAFKVICRLVPMRRLRTDGLVLSVAQPEGATPWTCAGTRTVKRSPDGFPPTSSASR